MKWHNANNEHILALEQEDERVARSCCHRLKAWGVLLTISPIGSARLPSGWGWATEALVYNRLVISRLEIQRPATAGSGETQLQVSLLRGW